MNQTTPRQTWLEKTFYGSINKQAFGNKRTLPGKARKFPSSAPMFHVRDNRNQVGVRPDRRKLTNIDAGQVIKAILVYITAILLE
jgi:hypothetical protein